MYQVLLSSNITNVAYGIGYCVYKRSLVTITLCRLHFNIVVLSNQDLILKMIKPVVTITDDEKFI